MCEIRSNIYDSILPVFQQTSTTFGRRAERFPFDTTLNERTIFVYTCMILRFFPNHMILNGPSITCGLRIAECVYLPSGTYRFRFPATTESKSFDKPCTQCAAVNTQFSLIADPPQMCRAVQPVMSCSDICHGNSPLNGIIVCTRQVYIKKNI